MPVQDYDSLFDEKFENFLREEYEIFTNEINSYYQIIQDFFYILYGNIYEDYDDNEDDDNKNEDDE